MRISTSNQYHHGTTCNLADCERRYCSIHRLLWSDCDTAKPDFEGSGRKVTLLGDCPSCERDYRMKEAQRYAEQWEATHGKQSA